MKKIILSFVVLICSLMNISCVTPNGIEYITISYNDVYEYYNRIYPVYYIDHIAYYWYLDQWVIVPRSNYHLIRHFDHPRYFSGYYPRRNYDMPRRPHTRHSDIRHHNEPRRPDIHHRNNGFRNERLNQNRPRPNSSVRPNSRPSSRPNSGNRNFGGRR